MKSLLIYDSLFGNTQKIAQSIASSLTSCQLVSVAEASPQMLDGIDLLIIGSPTQGGQATVAIQKFIAGLPENALKDKKIAVFDTRMLTTNVNLLLKLIIQLFGYAAPKMAAQLMSKGGKMLLPPTGFGVKGKEGPLLPGEQERSSKWINI